MVMRLLWVIAMVIPLVANELSGLLYEFFRAIAADLPQNPACQPNEWVHGQMRSTGDLKS